MSTLKTTNLQHASAASPAIVLASDGTATAQLSSLNGGALSGARNRIINGDMRVDQRNAGAALTSGYAYCLDRWITNPTTANTTVQRVAGPSGFDYALRISGASGNASAQIMQRIEAVNCSDLAGGAITVSFTASASTSTTVNVSYAYPSAVDNWGSGTYTAGSAVTVTTSAMRYSVTFASLPANVSNGLALLFSVNSGLGSGATLTITGVQLEPGTVATPFERRSYGQELALCQRYFESTKATGSFYTFRAYNLSNSNNNLYPVSFKVTKRSASPTITLFDAAGNSGKVQIFDSISDPQNQNYNLGSIGNDGFHINPTSSNQGVRCTYTVSDEL